MLRQRHCLYICGGRRNLLKLENYREGESDRHGFAVPFARSPVRRCADDAESLLVKRFVSAAKHLDVTDLSVSTDSELEDHTPLDTFRLGSFGIFQMGVDPFREFTGITAVEGGLDLDHAEGNTLRIVHHVLDLYLDLFRHGLIRSLGFHQRCWR